MGFSAKTGKIFIRGSQEQKDALFWVQNIKVPFGIGHPHLHIKPSLYVCRRVQGSQIFKQNWIISICLRIIVFFLIWLSLALGVGQLGGGIWGDHLQCTWVQECSEVKNLQTESNYLDYFRTFWILVFWAPCGSWGGGRWVGASGDMRRCPHTCAHAQMHMYRNCKWPPSWRHPCLPCLTFMHVRACMWMSAWGAPTHWHPPLPQYIHPYPNPPVSYWGPPQSVKIQ